MHPIFQSIQEAPTGSTVHLHGPRRGRQALLHGLYDERRHLQRDAPGSVKRPLSCALPAPNFSGRVIRFVRLVQLLFNYSNHFSKCSKHRRLRQGFMSRLSRTFFVKDSTDNWMAHEKEREKFDMWIAKVSKHLRCVSIGGKRTRSIRSDRDQLRTPLALRVNEAPTTRGSRATRPPSRTTNCSKHACVASCRGAKPFCVSCRLFTTTTNTLMTR